MDISEVRVGVLRLEGTNCEEETCRAYLRLGARPDMVHINHLASGERNIFDYHILMFPGGFSCGDYVRAGAIWAARLKSLIGEELKDYVKSGRLMCGICNGFQVLVELGLLPGWGRDMEVQASLAVNDSARFECRPTYLKYAGSRCAFTRDLKRGEVIYAPSAHMEGKFILPKEKEKAWLKRLRDGKQIVFRYVTPEGRKADYPWNPNGSLYDIAGISNPKGNVFGMMPHPERSFYVYHYPDWTRRKKKGSAYGDGERIFRSAVNYVCDKFKT